MNRLVSKRQNPLKKNLQTGFRLVSIQSRLWCQGKDGLDELPGISRAAPALQYAKHVLRMDPCSCTRQYVSKRGTPQIVYFLISCPLCQPQKGYLQKRHTRLRCARPPSLLRFADLTLIWMQQASFQGELPRPHKRGGYLVQDEAWFHVLSLY